MTRRYPPSSKAVRRQLDVMDVFFRGKPDAVDAKRFGQLPAKAGDWSRESTVDADIEADAVEVRERQGDGRRGKRP